MKQYREINVFIADMTHSFIKLEYISDIKSRIIPDDMMDNNYFINYKRIFMYIVNIDLTSDSRPNLNLFQFIR